MVIDGIEKKGHSEKASSWTAFRALVRITGSLWPPIHPAWLSSSSVTYRRVCALLAPRHVGASTPIVDPVILTRALNPSFYKLLIIVIVLLQATKAQAQFDATPTPFESNSSSKTAAASPAFAGNDEMALFQDIPSVFSASKYEQKVTDAPSSVTILTATDIKRSGYRTLADILGATAGFYVTSDRNYEYIGVRGFSRPGDLNSRILVLINGHRINDNIYDAVAVGTDGFLDLNAVEKIEIIRGPSSSLYGTNAFFAVINIITKRGRDANGLEIGGAWGSYNSFRGSTTYGKRFTNGLEAFFSGAIYDSVGPDLYSKEFDQPENNNGLFVKGDYDRYYRAFARLTCLDLAIQGGFSSRRKGIPTASYDTAFNDTRNRTVDQRGFVELAYEKLLTPWVTISTRAFFDHYDYEGIYVYLDEPADRLAYYYENHDAATGNLWGAELRGTFHFFDRVTLVLGGELQHNFQQDQSNYDAAVLLDERRHTINGGLFLQGTLQLLKNLELNLGVREDFYHAFGGTTNPRVALLYHPWQRTDIKLLYGSAFRSPSALEIYYHDGYNTTKPSQNLDPETIHTAELVVNQQIWEPIQTTVSLFYSKIANLIDLQVDPVDGLLIYQNRNDVRSAGVEFALEGHWPGGAEGQLSYSFQDAKDQASNRWLSNSPKHQAKLRLLLPLLKNRLFASTNLQYSSSRRTLQDTRTDAYILADLTLLSQGFIKGWSLRGSIYNLFDKSYGYPGSTEHAQSIILQNGRTFWVEAAYAF
jgi:outer membrane receptor for ferrienterochelin and colicins